MDSSEIVMRPFLLNNFKFAVSKSLMKLRPKVETELIEKARSLPCILYKAQDTVTEDLMKAWGISFKDLEVNRIYPNYTTLARMVNKGQGWAILPMHTEIDEESNHIIPMTTKSLFNRKFHICYRKEFSSSKWMKELLSEIKILSSNY
jgi:DNA-binding transcriptional LysR family regulator